MLPAMLSLVVSALFLIAVCEHAVAQETFRTMAISLNATVVPNISQSVKTFSKSVTIGMIVSQSSTLVRQPQRSGFEVLHAFH
jgi:hypothetical protein